jgi:hypothetical protein
MSDRSVTEADLVMEQAMAAEIRRAIAGKNIPHNLIYERLGKTQSWFSRRYHGHTPWRASELKRVCDILDKNIVEVYAAGTAALIEKDLWSDTTNLCLSHSGDLVDEQLDWARRGYELAIATKCHGIDQAVKVA